MKNIGQVISDTGIPREDFSRIKMIAGEATIADPINQATERNKKSLP